MERSLKHMLVISKKYFNASFPSVFGPYPHRHSIRQTWIHSAIYLHAANAATAPSAAAVVSCLTSFVLQSPAAKIPGCDVKQSSAARIKPLPSSFTTSANTSFCGICPTAMNTPDTSSLNSLPVFLLFRISRSTEFSPIISFTVVLSINSTFSLFSSLFTILSSPRNSSLRWIR